MMLIDNQNNANGAGGPALKNKQEEAEESHKGGMETRKGQNQ